MKRLLYVTQYYASKGQPGASRHYQHIRNFMRHGYQVTLITSYVKHRFRVIPPEYEGIKIAEENDGDLSIYKCYAYPNYGADFRTRMLNYLSFMFYAIVAGLKAPACDLVLASSPSLFVGLAGYLLSRLRRVPFIFEVRDLWPETAVVMGSLRNPMLIKLATWLAYFLYRKADRVVAVTEGIRQGILKSGIPESKVVFVPNGVDDDLFANLSDDKAQAVREEYGWGNRFVAIYAGTLAASDGLESIVRAAAALSNYEDILVVFLGDGEVKSKLQALAQELEASNVMFIPSQPKSRVPHFVRAADVCITPVKNDPFFSMTLPNKLFDYLAGGRAIIGAVPSGEAQRLIQEAGAGLVVPPEDELRLAAALLELRDDPEARERYGRNGRAYVMKHYLRSHLAARLIATMDETLFEHGIALEPGKEPTHELEQQNVPTHQKSI
jgi:glycosyltransferase involved in cell wall biosynthesis